MKLVTNWKSAWRWFSVHLILFLAVVPEVWLYLPAEWKQSLPSDFLSKLTMVVGGLAVFARMVSQEKKVKPDDATTEDDSK